MFHVSNLKHPQYAFSYLRHTSQHACSSSYYSYTHSHTHLLLLPLTDSSAARHPITHQELPPEGWMRSPLCLCRRVCGSLVNTDKLALLRRIVDFLTSLAPVTTLVIILLLSYHSYQVARPVPPSGCCRGFGWILRFVSLSMDFLLQIVCA